ncbi:hypothetical protein PRZ48_010246 [Zasmidium cellare]|uniref:Wax synthase domain-containing protein n=1 Tax=Zasmidium cellare TaxID=395010 RepID=A0ABR0E921_ZASCE|nr:hypothetical protein PRZ48_010246 [Zasmidium cellare]
MLEWLRRFREPPDDFFPRHGLTTSALDTTAVTNITTINATAAYPLITNPAAIMHLVPLLSACYTSLTDLIRSIFTPGGLLIAFFVFTVFYFGKILNGISKLYNNVAAGYHYHYDTFWTIGKWLWLLIIKPWVRSQIQDIVLPYIWPSLSAVRHDAYRWAVHLFLGTVVHEVPDWASVVDGVSGWIRTVVVAICTGLLWLAGWVVCGFVFGWVWVAWAFLASLAILRDLANTWFGHTKAVISNIREFVWDKVIRLGLYWLLFQMGKASEPTAQPSSPLAKTTRVLIDSLSGTAPLRLSSPSATIQSTRYTSFEDDEHIPTPITNPKSTNLDVDRMPGFQHVDPIEGHRRWYNWSW